LVKVNFYVCSYVHCSKGDKKIWADSF